MMIDVKICSKSAMVSRAICPSNVMQFPQKAFYTRAKFRPQYQIYNKHTKLQAGMVLSIQQQVGFS